MPRVFSPWVIGVAAIGLLVLAEPTGSSTRPVAAAIEVDAAGRGCLDADRMAAHVVAWLGPHELDARIHILVRADPDNGARAQFQLWRGGDLLVDRAFEPLPEQCDRADAALGLAIAIAVDSTILEPFGVPSPKEVPAPTAGPELGEPKVPPHVEPEPGPEPLATRPAPHERRIAMRLQGTMAAGLHPTVGFGGRLRNEILVHRRFALTVGGFATQGLATSVGPGQATVTLLAADLDGCTGGTPARVRLHGCVGLAGGASIARGLELPANTRSVAAWLAAFAGLSLTYPDRAVVALGVDLELAVPILRPRLVVTDFDTGEVGAARDFPPVGALLSIGPVVQLP